MNSEHNIETAVVSSLDKLGVIYEIIEISSEFADTAAFCREYGFSLENCGNTIVVASKRHPKRYSACIVRGSDRLNVNKTVRKLMEASRLSFASAEETTELTGMMIGGVTPFALPEDLVIYVDEKLLSLDYVILGSGSRSTKVRICPCEMTKIPNVEFVADLSIG